MPHASAPCYAFHAKKGCVCASAAPYTVTWQRVQPLHAELQFPIPAAQPCPCRTVSGRVAAPAVSTSSIIRQDWITLTSLDEMSFTMQRDSTGGAG